MAANLPFNRRNNYENQNILCGFSIAVALQLGMLAGSAQTNIYLFTGSETNVTLPPGTYIITAYGAPGAYPSRFFAVLGGYGGLGALISAEFNFSTPTTLTLLVGGSGYDVTIFGDGGGGGGSFVIQGSTPLVIAGGGGGGAYSSGGNGNVSNNGGRGSGGYYGYGGTNGGGGGGGGGSIIDPSAIAILSEVSGTFSPDDAPNLDTYYSGNGEIIITAVPTPLLITTHSAFGFTNGAFGFNVIGPSGSNVVIQASTDLKTWIPLQTNLLGNAPLYFSDAQSSANTRRFYRLQLSP